MFITRTPHIRIAILTDREEYMEAQQLQKWFDSFMERSEKALSPSHNKIRDIWSSLSIAERLEIRTEIRRRVRACQKADIPYAQAVKGIFFEHTDTLHNKAVRDKRDAEGVVASKQG